MVGYIVSFHLSWTSCKTEHYFSDLVLYFGGLIRCFLGECSVLAEELSLIDADSSLWSRIRPLLDIALRLEQHDDTYVWHGWRKSRLNAFLKSLPAHCTLVVGVWETGRDEEGQEREQLILGCVCEVIEGEIHTIRTFEAFVDSDLPPIQALEPGFEHALAIMRVARIHVAPVAWALFTDKTTWDEWLFAVGEDGAEINKGDVLTSFAHQGRCVLLGSQATHHHREDYLK
jgi:hypothetical protein